MIGIRINKRDAEVVKGLLTKHGLFNNDYLVIKEGDFIVFPLKEEVGEFDKKLKDIMDAEGVNYEIINTNFKRRERFDFEELLKQELGERLGDKVYLVRKSFDIIGDIAVLEIPRELEFVEKEIARIFLKTHPNVKTVLKKKGAHEGSFRIQKLELLAGEDKKETIYVENKARFKLNLEEVYFSPRLASERLRIARLVKKDEKVLVMFSGYAPYPITILKNSGENSKPKIVFGVELNPKAHEYALINKELNKIPDEKLVLLNGDVREVVPELMKRYSIVKDGFDRIVMPLPKTGFLFLNTAFKAIKNEGIIHYYMFLEEGEIPKKGFEVIQEEAEKAGVKVEFLNHVVCGQVGKRLYRVCFDFRVIKEGNKNSKSGE